MSVRERESKNGNRSMLTRDRRGEDEDELGNLLVSTETIRKDFVELGEMGLPVRVHRGARLKLADRESVYSIREPSHLRGTRFRPASPSPQSNQGQTMKPGIRPDYYRIVFRYKSVDFAFLNRSTVHSSLRERRRRRAARKPPNHLRGFSPV